MSNIRLENVRLSFNNLFEAEGFDGNDDLAFNAKFIIEKGSDADKAIRAALLAASNEAFAGKGADVIKKVSGDKSQFCYQPYGDDGELMILAAKRKAKAGRPLVIDVDRSPLTADDNKPYSGCYVNALVRPWAMASKGKSWIRCGLEGVQFVRDGEAFGSRAKADDFDDVSASSSTVDDLL